MYSYKQALNGVTRFEEDQELSVSFGSMLFVANLLAFTNRLVDTIGQHEYGDEVMRERFQRLVIEGDVLSDNIKGMIEVRLVLEERVAFLIESDKEMTELYMRIQDERDELVDETIELIQKLASAQLTIQLYEEDRRGVRR